MNRGTHGGVLREWAVPRILDHFLPAEYDDWDQQWYQIENNRFPAAIGLLVADFMMHGITDPIVVKKRRIADGHLRLWWAVQQQIPMLGVELLDVHESVL